jgi:hypothetical protein
MVLYLLGHLQCENNYVLHLRKHYCVRIFQLQALLVHKNKIFEYHIKYVGIYLKYQT